MYADATVLCIFETSLEGDSLHFSRLANNTFYFMFDINDKVDDNMQLTLGVKHTKKRWVP